MGKGVLLSYRRDDSSGHTELWYRHFGALLGTENVFRDIHKIHPADRFREVIRQAIAESAVVIVIISRQWTAVRAADGTRRLDQLDDVVRWEICSALALGKPIVPILVGRATMPPKTDLPEDIRELTEFSSLELSEDHSQDDVDRLLRALSARAPGLLPPAPQANPFFIRGGIRQDEDFHGRRHELNILRDYLRGRQNCQLVGHRRIGKSTLLLFAQRHCLEWSSRARVAYLDLQDPRCYTLAGWLREVGHGLKLASTPASLTDLMDAVDDLIDQGEHPVLLLDEFGEMTRRAQEFPRELFLTLRACGQRGASILTAAPKKLSELTDPRDDTSPFFNTFPVLHVSQFSSAEAEAFVSKPRTPAVAFPEREKERILEFAKGHPLALQTACYHVLNARYFGEDLALAIARARADCGSALGDAYGA